MVQMNTQLEQAKSEFKIKQLQQEALVKKDLMKYEFELNMQLKDVEAKASREAEVSREDRKDERTKMQASQKSALIDQKEKGKGPQRFESSGNDVIGGGMRLNKFDPR